MLTFIHKWFLSVALVAAGCLSSARADDVRPLRPGVAEARAKILAPFLDDQTIGVARFDLSGNVDEAWLALAERICPAAQTPTGSEGRLRSFVEKFKAAGGCDVYVVASLADMPDRPPFFIAPLCKGANEEDLGDALALLPCEVHERLGDVVFAGSRETRRRLDGAAPTSRPELARAWEVIGDAPYQLVFLPSASVRKVVEELMPVLPPSLGSVPTRVFTRGAMWATLALDAAPRPGLRLVAQSADHSAANMFRMQSRGVLLRVWPEGAAFIPAITPEPQKDRLVVQLGADQLQGLMNVVRPVFEKAVRLNRLNYRMDQLKQIGMAMHSYADAHKHLPPAAITDAQSRPLLSWRVAILPYLGQESLYKEFRLDEPWDSEHNRKLIDRMPAAYRLRGSAAPHDRTSFVVPVGPGTTFEGPKGIGIADITDGTSNTLMAFEADDEHAVVWTTPDDFVFDPERPSAGLTSAYPDGRLILFCDGSAHFLNKQLDDETLRRIMIRNDGKPLPMLH